MGSTTYDEAEEVFEPGWSGASWYGPTSGTYWTLNPKEYADPRKHGPEYQARGRGTPGATGGAGPAARAESAAGQATGPTGGNGAPADAADAAGATGDAQASTGARDGGLPPAWRAAWTAGRAPDEPAPPFEHDPTPPRAAPRPGAALGEAPRFGVADAGGGAVAGMPAAARSVPGSPRLLHRLVLAVVGWLPVGLALGAAVGLPGGLLATLPLQVLGLVLLAFQPRVAWAAAGGATAVAFAAIPVTAVVAALGGGVAPGGPAPLAAVVLALAAWLAGAVAAASGRLIAYPWDPQR